MVVMTTKTFECCIERLKSHMLKKKVYDVRVVILKNIFVYNLYRGGCR